MWATVFDKYFLVTSQNSELTNSTFFNLSKINKFTINLQITLVLEYGDASGKNDKIKNAYFKNVFVYPVKIHKYETVEILIENLF